MLPSRQNPRTPKALAGHPARRAGLVPATFPVLLALMAPLPAKAQDCPEGRVSRIFIDNHSVFDPASIPDDRRIRWAYRLANRIHVRTRPGFIEHELLLRSGDCYDPALARESARILREFRFIASADAYSVRQPDGSRHLLVETRDEWTTKLAGDVEFDGGPRLRGASITEENFLGRGISVAAFYLERDERRDVGGRFEVPGVQGTNWDLGLSGARTRVGPAWSQEIVHPFLGEIGTFALRQRVTFRRDLHTWALPAGQDWTHLVVPVEGGRIEVASARRFGRPGSYYILGGGASREWIRSGALSEVEGVREGDFSDRGAVPDSIAAPLAGQLAQRDAFRLSLLGGMRRVSFEQRRGLDALDGVQDVPVGMEVLLSTGPSFRIGSRTEGAVPSARSDIFARSDLFGGFAEGPWVGQLQFSVEARRLLGRSGSSAGHVVPSGARDVLAEGHAFLYHQRSTPFAHTLVLRGAFQAGWRTDLPFQLTLGGPDGVRGYSDTAFPGARRGILTVENRIPFRSPAPDLVDTGLTLFTDVGRMVPGDAPWGVDSGWRGTVGAGLRLGFPAGSAAVIRIDLALPVGPGAGGPRLLVQAREWVGFIDAFEHIPLARARRSGVRAQFPGVNRNPSVR
jgi:hypothetical protein